MDSFYDNLQTLFSRNDYPLHRLWNCDEIGAQAGREGRGMVIVKRGSRAVHSIIPDQREWLSCLVSINAAGSSIPSFQIFRRRRFKRNYIEYCEARATMAMQKRAWMTAYLFSAWISHFIKSVSSLGGILSTRRHLLIFNGHNSHVTLEMVREAREARLDLLTLPSHTSHALQPLDATVFKPFKTHFKEYRNFWTSRNMHQKVSKEILAQWVSLGLKNALSVYIITKGFESTGIYPLNRAAVQSKLAPSQNFDTMQVRDGGTLPGGVAAGFLAADHMAPAPVGDNAHPQVDEEEDHTEAFGSVDSADSPEDMVGSMDETCEAELKASFRALASTNTSHYFVDVDPSNPQ
jgi:hypothetical protein